MPLPIDVSLMVLAGLCLGTAVAIGVGQALASAIVALVGRLRLGARTTDSQG